MVDREKTWCHRCRITCSASATASTWMRTRPPSPAANPPHARPLPRWGPPPRRPPLPLIHRRWLPSSARSSHGWARPSYTGTHVIVTASHFLLEACKVVCFWNAIENNSSPSIKSAIVSSNSHELRWTLNFKKKSNLTKSDVFWARNIDVFPTRV